MDEGRFKNILKMYDAKYEMRFCREDELPRLVAFLDNYWRKNHVLSKSKELMDWQYLDAKNHRYNFIFAIYRETDEIHGILGFIKTDHFDEEIKFPMRWGAIWKIREDVASRGLGLAMKLYMYEHVKAPYAGGIGLSRFSREINKKMGEEMGKLTHFYMINPKMDTFLLIDNLKNSDKESGAIADENLKFVACDAQEFEKAQEDYLEYMLPYKSKLYYVNRFLKHPFYKYHCAKVVDGEQRSKAVFFYRICEHNDAKCIMIVDFLGTEKALIGTKGCFEKLLEDNQAEYISFYEYGLSEDALQEAGFKKRDESEVVIPLYYEPFEKVNVDIDFHYFNDTSVEEKKYFFKGDADQDRPNIL